MHTRLSVAMIAISLTVTSPAAAQYFDYTPRPPDVEVDLSVLGDTPTPTAPNSLGPLAPSIESMPLPPLGAPAPNPQGFLPPVKSIPPGAPPAYSPPAAPSPYERSRIVERVELDATARPTPASPFNPPMVLNAPKPPVEAPRTAPAKVLKPAPLSPLDGGDPLVVSGEDNPDGIEMPAQNVSTAIKSNVDTGVTLPARKPKDLARKAAPPLDAKTAAETVTTTPPPAPVTIVSNPPEPPEMPAGIRTSESVIEDLYTLPEHGMEGAEELAALPMIHEEAPPPAASNQADEATTSAGLLIFDSTSITLDDAMRDTLDHVLKEMKKKDGQRILIRAYAAGGDGTKATARNVSLARALAVRSYLMDEGFPTKNIDVRAMGRDTSVSPLDRVDLVVVR